MNFKNYLRTKRLSGNTVTAYSKRVENFMEWKTNENIQLSDLNYNDMLHYIAYLRQKKYSNQYINQLLCVVRFYLDYKINTGETLTNPAQNLIVKGVIRKIPSNLLEAKELDKLYKSYKPEIKVNKIILGLLIYQAITKSELHKLGPEHLKLEKAKIYIPGSRKSNSRILDLKAFQILELHNYINKTRQGLIKKTGSKTDQLFISVTGSNNLSNSLSYIFKELKKTNPKVKNAAQIRISVIANKLKTKDLRETQYFAGHKYVSSTERYKLNNIENLKKQIEKHHPRSGIL